MIPAARSGRMDSALLLQRLAEALNDYEQAMVDYADLKRQLRAKFPDIGKQKMERERDPQFQASREDYGFAKDRAEVYAATLTAVSATAALNKLRDLYELAYREFVGS